MFRKLMLGGLLGLGLLVVVALALGAAASPVLAQGPAGDGMMGGGMMGGGMMGGGMMGGGMMGGGMMGGGMMGRGQMSCRMMDGEEPGEGQGPGSDHTQSYTDTMPYGQSPMGRMGMMMGGWEGGPMTGGWNGVDPDATPLTIEQASEKAAQFLAAFGNEDLEVVEIMEFTGNFYAEVHEKSTGIGAFELLVDRYNGEVYPEPGPNMRWNQKYGMMRWSGGTPEAAMPITPEQAIEQAQKYLDRFNAGLTAAEAEPFYGYYTLHIERDGQVTGMLSVNGYTGAVWNHNWHGDFVGVGEMNEMKM